MWVSDWASELEWVSEWEWVLVPAWVSASESAQASAQALVLALAQAWDPAPVVPGTGWRGRRHSPIPHWRRRPPPQHLEPATETSGLAWEPE